jgi:hypothetical protein
LTTLTKTTFSGSLMRARARPGKQLHCEPEVNSDPK